MRFKEFLSDITKEAFKKEKSISNLGAITFTTSTFKDQIRTPHYDQRESLDAYERRPQVNSAVNQKVALITGNNIRIKSSDKQTNDFLNIWIRKRRKFYSEVRKFVTTYIITRNAYLERTYKQSKNGNLVLDNIFNINDCSRVHRNISDPENIDQYWIYEVPLNVQTQRFQNDMIQPEQFKISYIYGSDVLAQMIYGIPINKTKIAALNGGWSKDGIYGRSFIASIIDDVNIVEEIIKNWAKISRYRALNTKLISIEGTDEDVASLQDVKEIEHALDNKREEEHLVINKNFKIDSLTNVGEYDSMDAPIDFLRSDIGSGLVPNFMTPWANPNSAATSDRANIPFTLTIQNESREIIDFLNEAIIDELRKSHTFLATDATFVFDGVTLESAEEKINKAQILFNDGIITLNEYRTRVDLEPIDNGDKFKRELEGGQNLFNKITISKDGIQKENFQEKLDTKEDKEWADNLVDKGIIENRNNLTLSKKNDIGGKILRLVKDESDNKLKIFTGPNLNNSFELDEKKSANFFFEETKKKLKAMQDEFLDEEQPEDKLIEDMFKDVKKLHSEIVDELFDKIDSRQRKTSEAFMSTKIFGDLKDVFKKFDSKIKDIVNKFSKKSLNIIIKPTDETAEQEIDKKLEDQLKTRADLLIKSKTLDQLKTFNQIAAQDMKRMLADGIAAGKSPSEIKKDIKNKYTDFKTKKNNQDSNIDRIVRTEISSNINLMKLFKWKEQGFTKYLWQTREDEKVRTEHAKKNQRVFSIEKALAGKDIFPGGSTSPTKININCRCIPIVFE